MSADVGAKRCEVPTRLAVYPTPYGSVIVIPEAAEEPKKCDELGLRKEDKIEGLFFCLNCVFQLVKTTSFTTRMHFSEYDAVFTLSLHHA